MSFRFSIFTLILCAAATAAHAKCVERELSWAAWKDSDEYLYESSSDYKNKIAYECGGGYCGANDVVVFGPPVFYTFNGNTVTDTSRYHVFSCDPGYDDMWVELPSANIQRCPSCALKDIILEFKVQDKIQELIVDGTTGLVLHGRDNGRAAVSGKSGLCRCSRQDMVADYPSSPDGREEIDNCNYFLGACKDSGGQFAVNCATIKPNEWYVADAKTSCKCPNGASVDALGKCPQAAQVKIQAASTNTSASSQKVTQKKDTKKATTKPAAMQSTSTPKSVVA